MGIIYKGLPLWLQEPYSVAKGSVGEPALAEKLSLSRQNLFAHFSGTFCLSKVAARSQLILRARSYYLYAGDECFLVMPTKAGASLLGRIMACLLAHRFAGVFFPSFSEGRTAGVWGSGCRPSNKKHPAIDAQIIGVNLQVTRLHNECLRKILRSLLKKNLNSVSLGNVSKG